MKKKIIKYFFVALLFLIASYLLKDIIAPIAEKHQERKRNTAKKFKEVFEEKVEEAKKQKEASK
tara:strand:- start:1211 stop:1402 length:192 start_codon:yes stop_codon:yes gene_type:complete